MSAKLADLAVGRDNNFNLLRFVAAFAVLFSHCFPLTTGTNDSEPLSRLLGTTLGGVAVDVFFITSGFLVAGSLASGRGLTAYARARMLRIYPAATVAALLTVLVLGWHFTTHASTVYFTDLKTWHYLLKNSVLLFGVRMNLPGVFADLPFPVTVNGSLWTLPFELRLYLALGVVFWIVGRWPARASAAMRQAVLLIALATLAAWLALGNTGYAGFRFTALFFCGASFMHYRERVPMSRLIFAAAVAAATLAAIAGPSAFALVYPLVIGYLTLWLAYVPRGVIRRFNTLGDYSYGVYIYAFPIQQSVVALNPGIGWLPLFGWSASLTLLLGVASWHLIERPALRLKRVTGALPARTATA